MSTSAATASASASELQSSRAEIQARGLVKGAPVGNENSEKMAH